MALNRSLNANSHEIVFAFWSGAHKLFTISIHKITDRELCDQQSNWQQYLCMYMFSIGHMVWIEQTFFDFNFYKYSNVD